MAILKIIVDENVLTNLIDHDSKDARYPIPSQLNENSTLHISDNIQDEQHIQQEFSIMK